MKQAFSNVEQAFLAETQLNKISTKIPYVTTESFPQLGLLSAMSFLEWVIDNPEGVVSLVITSYSIHYTKLYETVCQLNTLLAYLFYIKVK